MSCNGCLGSDYIARYCSPLEAATPFLIPHHKEPQPRLEIPPSCILTYLLPTLRSCRTAVSASNTCSERRELRKLKTSTKQCGLHEMSRPSSYPHRRRPRYPIVGKTRHHFRQLGNGSLGWPDLPLCDCTFSSSNKIGTPYNYKNNDAAVSIFPSCLTV